MDLIMKSFLEGYATSELNVGTMFFCMGIAAAIGLYIFLIYKLVNKNSFYNRNFNISLIALTVITAAIILTIQSNIVVSLGMVGALSIVRFRTAIKYPMDLVFLFWSISVGIICGAGFAHFCPDRRDRVRGADDYHRLPFALLFSPGNHGAGGERG